MNTAQASIGDWSALYKVPTNIFPPYPCELHRLLTMLYISEKYVELYQMKSVSSIRCH